MYARIFIEISNGSYYVEKLVKISWTGKIRADRFKTLIPQNPRHQIRRGHFMLIGHVTVTLSQNQNQSPKPPILNQLTTWKHQLHQNLQRAQLIVRIVHIGWAEGIKLFRFFFIIQISEKKLSALLRLTSLFTFI